MSGPGDDDLDDVTLWAGRLRAWPVAPQVADDGDETVRTPRRGSAVPDSAPVDDGDETVRAPRDGAAVPASLPVDEGDGDETEPSSPRAAIAEDMERGGRVESEAVTDDDTAPMRAERPFVGASGGIVDDLTVPSRSIAGAPARPNGTAVPVESPGGASPELGEDAGAAVDDTAAGVRRPRAASPPVVDRRNPPLAREAHEPTALHRDAYAPRVDAPVRVSRNAAAPAPRGADAATVSPRRSRGAARLILLVAAMAAVVILAAVGLVLLIG